MAKSARYLVTTRSGTYTTSTLAEAKAVERAGGVPPKRKRSAKRRRNPAPLAPGARVRVSSGCRARGVEKGDWGTVESIQELGADYGYSVKLTIQWSLGRGSRVWFVRHANRLGDLEISANDGNPSHKLRLERAPAGYGVAKHRNPTADEHERLAQSLTEAAQQWLYEAEAGQPGDLHTRMDYVTAFDFASRADEEAAHAPHFNDTNLSRVRSAARMGIERNPRKRRNGAVSQDAVLYVQHFDAKGRPHGKARKTTLAQFLVDHAADSDACDAARHLRVGDGVTLGGGGAPGLYVSRKGKKNPSAEEVGHAVGKYGAKGAAAVGRGLAAFGRGLWSASKGAVKGVQAAAAEAAAKREAAAKAAAEAQKAEAKLEQKVAALPAPAAPVANPAKRRKARR